MVSHLAGKIVLITGGARGLGLAIAEAFRKGGAEVVLADRDRELGCQAAESLGARFQFVDVRDESSIEQLVESTVEEFGRLDCAVNNAGILGPLKPLWEYSTQEFDDVIATNLDGCFYGMKYQIPALLDSGGGTILNISSVNGLEGMANCAIYSASKAGILGLTQTAALEYADCNIRINALCPGGFETSFLRNDSDEVAEAVPCGRLGQPEELGDLVAWMTSPAASYIHGAAIRIDGGLLL